MDGDTKIIILFIKTIIEKEEEEVIRGTIIIVCFCGNFLQKCSPFNLLLIIYIINNKIEKKNALKMEYRFNYLADDYLSSSSSPNILHHSNYQCFGNLFKKNKIKLNLRNFENKI